MVASFLTATILTAAITIPATAKGTTGVVSPVLAVEDDEESSVVVVVVIVVVLLSGVVSLPSSVFTK